jgi:hypothetical protein
VRTLEDTSRVTRAIADDAFYRGSGGGGGGGITRLTGDVLAGPGSGSVASTVVNLTGASGVCSVTALTRLVFEASGGGSNALHSLLSIPSNAAQVMSAGDPTAGGDDCAMIGYDFDSGTPNVYFGYPGVGGFTTPVFTYLYGTALVDIGSITTGCGINIAPNGVGLFPGVDTCTLFGSQFGWTYFSGAFSGDTSNGTGVIAIGPATDVPTAPASVSYMLYVVAGALKGMGTSATVTTIGAADLPGFEASGGHCPKCGGDFGHAWENSKTGKRLTVCMWCLTEHLNIHEPWLIRE